MLSSLVMVSLFVIVRVCCHCLQYGDIIMQCGVYCKILVFVEC